MAMTYFLSSEGDGWLIEYVYSTLVVGTQYSCLCLFYCSFIGTF